jgi:16S rRNA (cytidine1402-2'-O)-methyltransferase
MRKNPTNVPNQRTGILYVVALPIGNCEDITLRAARILGEVDLIACEDTRNFKRLCGECQILPKRVVSYHEHNEEESAEGLLQLLEQGTAIAIVSDAGTPGINDPGFRAVTKARERGIEIVPVPGASAVATALSASQIGGGEFLFVGFLPSKESQRGHKLQVLKRFKTKIVLFEAPHRLLATLNSVREIFGEISVEIFRELTKEHEEYYFGEVSDCIAFFSSKKILGELTVILSPAESDSFSLEDLELEIREMLKRGESGKEITKALTSASPLSRKDIYEIVERVKAQLD